MSVRVLSRFSPQIYPVLLLISLCLAQGTLQKISSGATASVELPSQYIGLSINPKVISNFLGIRLLTADLLWIDTLIKSDITKEPQPYGAFYKTFDIITDLNPDHIYGYYVSGIYMSVIKDDSKVPRRF